MGLDADSAPVFLFSEAGKRVDAKLASARGTTGSGQAFL